MKNAEQPINHIPGSHQGMHPKEVIGLTKREYFAGLAMQGIMADGETSDIPSIAKASILIADELLKQLDETTLTP